MKTACPLDCYDGCSVIYREGRLLGDRDHPATRGFLCSKLNHYSDYPQLERAFYRGRPISLDEAVEILSQRLRESDSILHFRGSGNVGKMQGVTDLLFARLGATLTKGSLCDGAGQLGIQRGRRRNLVLPLEQIEKSELVIIWGRNVSYTNSHLLPLLHGKTLVVIDPVKTDIALRAQMHLQINPRTDLELATMLARFIYMQNGEDEPFIEERTENYDSFVDLIKEYRMVPTVERIGVDILDIATLAELMQQMATVILVGNGVQKYSHGTEVVHMIDSLAAMLGLFGKEGSGVSFLGDTSLGLEDPFRVDARRVSKASVDFGEYDLTFIQASNPVVTMPQSQKVIDGLQKSFTVVFGLYEDETAQLADLVIPAKNFLQKRDIRFSYGHEYVQLMPKIEENRRALSEYELTERLFEKFGFDGLKGEEEYIEEFRRQLIQDGEYYKIPTYQEIPYSQGFGGEPFSFIDEVEDEVEEGEEGLYLITPKAQKAINSQFQRDPYLYVPVVLGLADGDRVVVKSEYGEVEMEVRVSERLRDNVVLAYSGSRINYVTPGREDNYGNNAIFQEVRVRVEPL
ncbi:MAG: molybdopterin-dependent oxidoreductase [Epsilonproteobacteria bacterium]|nr:molybdopterin oxidoreductase [Campylobacterota bacterium]NPA57345.1 molybdopterin-dependent oxidoreductase [Campylobacterota bacterium]